MKKRLTGEHVVIDPDIQHGTPVFRGTRIAVADVLERVARNEDWDGIVAEYEGVISTDAIAEAVRLAGEVFLDHARVPPKAELDAPPSIYGEYVIADPGICHGTPTFRGTRIFVADVIEEVADRWSWDYISAQWRGDVPGEAIAEAIRVASRIFHEHAPEYSLQPATA